MSREQLLQCHQELEGEEAEEEVEEKEEERRRRQKRRRRGGDRRPGRAGTGQSLPRRRAGRNSLCALPLCEPLRTSARQSVIHCMLTN